MQPTDEQLDAALFGLVSDDFVVVPTSEPAGGLEPLVSASSNVVLRPDQGCLAIRNVGPDPQVVVAVDSGAALFVRATSTDGAAEAFLAKYSPTFSAQRVRQLVLSTTTSTAVVAPDLGPGETWLVRLDPGVASSRVCVGTWPGTAT